MDVDFSIFQDMLEKRNSNDSVNAVFYDKTTPTGVVLSNGLPEFKERLFIRIKTKDNPDVFDQPASQDYIHRFPMQYQRYLLEKKEVGAGTPLKQFAFLTGSQLESCKFRGIFTVERLAELEEDKAGQLGLTDERELAIKFIEANKNNKKLDDFAKKEKKYQAEIKKLKEQIEELKTQLKEKENG